MFLVRVDDTAHAARRPGAGLGMLDIWTVLTRMWLRVYRMTFGCAQTGFGDVDVARVR